MNPSDTLRMQAVSQQGSTEAIEAYRFRQVESRHAAQAIVDFITSLKTFHLAEFWLPCKWLAFVYRKYSADQLLHRHYLLSNIDYHLIAALCRRNN